MMCCTQTLRWLIVLTVPPRYRCPLNLYRPLGSCSRAAGWSAATSCYGPTRSFCGIIAYVRRLRTSGLDLLAARLSESDPQRSFIVGGDDERAHFEYRLSTSAATSAFLECPP